MPKRTIFLIVMSVLVLHVRAQTHADTLRSTWQDTSLAPEVRARGLHDLINNGYLFEIPDSAFIMAGWLYQFAVREGLTEWKAVALMDKGGSHYARSQFDSALFYQELSLPLFEEAGQMKGVASVLGNMANIITEQGDFAKGITYYRRALKIQEELGNQQGIGIQLMNIGISFNELGQQDEASNYLQQALAVHEANGFNGGVADCKLNIGNLQMARGEYTEAETTLRESLALFEEIPDRYGVAFALAGLGKLRKEQGRLDEARTFIEQALVIQRELEDENETAVELISLGDVYMQGKDFRSALAPLEEALAMGERIGSILRVEEAARKLHLCYKALGDTGKALRNYEISITARDSIQSEANHRELFKQEYKYLYEKQALTDSLGHAADTAIQHKEIQRQKTVRNGFMGGFVLVALFAAVFFFQRNRIGREKARSEELLLNILPEEIAEELKAKGEADAQLIDNVTVLFTDFKGFTAMSETLTPKELVRDIHECFSAFDHICEKWGIEKIKTIGDAFMAAGGLPTPNTTHPYDVVMAALEIRDFIEEGKVLKVAKGLPYFEIRIGVHTGPVVAGIVGVKKFQYDIWGDTVNTASRMESSGAVGQVNISEATFTLVKETSSTRGEPLFRFTPRGKVQAKGKGEMEMFFVEKA